MGYSFHQPPFVKECIDIGWRLITPKSLQRSLRELGSNEGDTERRVAAQRGRVAGMQSEHVASIELDFAIRTRIQSVPNAMTTPRKRGQLRRQFNAKGRQPGPRDLMLPLGWGSMDRRFGVIWRRRAAASGALPLRILL